VARAKKVKAKKAPPKKAAPAKSKRNPSARASTRGNSAPKAKTKGPSSGGRTRARSTPRPAPKKKAAPKKAAPKTKAAKTRARAAARARELESIRASEHAVASKKGAKVRKRRRSARERQGIIEARIAEAPKKTQAVYDTLSSALERMRRTAGVPLDLSFDVPPAEEGTSQLWLVRARFEPRGKGKFGYQELAEVLAQWRDDYTLEASVHPQRIAFVRWHYEGKRGRRKSGGYAPSGLGAWNRVIDEAAADADDFQESYSESQIAYVTVQFAARTLTGPVVKL
jgi:hypothetical protein